MAQHPIKTKGQVMKASLFLGAAAFPRGLYSDFSNVSLILVAAGHACTFGEFVPNEKL